MLFKESYSLSPSKFRSNPKLPSEPRSQTIIKRIQDLQKNKPIELLKQMDMQISFEELADIKLVYKRFKGNYKNLSPVWQAYCEEMESSFPDFSIEFYGISYDDPLIVGEDKCLYDLCAIVTEKAKVKGENHRKIPGGLYLCYRFKNHVQKIDLIYNDLFAIWMPHRGYVMGPGNLL